MKKIIFSFTIVGLLVACSESPKNTSSDNTEHSTSIAVIPNSVATIEIDGMVCQMGCGASIRKELTATGGVSNCEFDFKEGRKTNVATVAYDNEAISEEELIKLVSTINDNQFTVGSTESTELEELHEASEETNTNNSDQTNVEMSSSSGIEIPNILKVFSDFLFN
ncbi:MAG: heavy-metal-associated domain-containing protein [Crocinitomicaceae bacterium]|nr:heavy-metal-associated domain-containing protein [Crocinitomicaceae bacterium]